MSPASRSCECERGRPGVATIGSGWAWGATPNRQLAVSRSEPARRAQTLAVVFVFCLPAGGSINQKQKRNRRDEERMDSKGKKMQMAFLRVDKYALHSDTNSPVPIVIGTGNPNYK